MRLNVKIQACLPSLTATYSVLGLVLTKSATAQGIIAQFRIFGGSLGVAASSAIRNAVEERELGTPVSPETIATVTPADNAARQSYTDTFNEGMTVCMIMATTCMLVSLFTYNKNPKTVEEA